MVTICSGCNKKIEDRFLMKVLNKSWHSNCLVCSQCHVTLSDQCFDIDGKLYCKVDYYKNQQSLCTRCKGIISETDLIRRTGKNCLYHLHCFVCSSCSRQLDTGEEYYTLHDSRILCRKDFQSHKASDNKVDSTTDHDVKLKISSPTTTSTGPPPDTYISDHITLHHTTVPLQSDSLVSTTVCQSPNPDTTQDTLDNISIKKEDTCSEGDEQLKNDDASLAQVSTTTGKRRGPRTTIKSKQLEILKDAFSSTPKPTRHIREQLATKTGLNMRVIQVWFQNRRSKERRMKQMSLANRGRYPLPHDHHDPYSFVSDQYYRSDCFYEDPHQHQHNYMQCYSMPMGVTRQPDPHWSRQQTQQSWSSPLLPDSSNQVAFLT